MILDTFGIFRRINKQFQINYLKLPERHSVSQLLDAWVILTINLIT
jgi:hypothetical protein